MADEKRKESRARVLVVEDEEIIREILLKTLDEEGWNISRAATILGVERTNLHTKMRSYGIRRAEG